MLLVQNHGWEWGFLWKNAIYNLGCKAAWAEGARETLHLLLIGGT